MPEEENRDLSEAIVDAIDSEKLQKVPTFLIKIN